MSKQILLEFCILIIVYSKFSCLYFYFKTSAISSCFQIPEEGQKILSQIFMTPTAKKYPKMRKLVITKPHTMITQSAEWVFKILE